jgi:hypothetical protein
VLEEGEGVMARRQKVSHSRAFVEVSDQAKSIGERNDCSIRAITLVTGLPYETVLKEATRLGRKKGAGTPPWISKRTLENLGFNVVIWGNQDIMALINSYPSPHNRNCRFITTHHPRRFPKAWAALKEERLIMYNFSHMLAVVDGEVHDWSVNRVLRMKTIWTVVKKP